MKHLICFLLLLSLAACLPAQNSSPKKAEKSSSNGDLTLNKSLGSSKAPVTLEVFTDFECPACRELYLKTLKRVIEDYVPSQKVYLLHRDYPLPNHKHSKEAARYANAAATINKYEAVTEALFTNQSTWAASGNVEGTVAQVLTPAEMKKVKQVLQDKGTQIDAAIDKDVFQGNINGVRQTPTMIIRHNGQAFPAAGIVEYGILRRFLDDRLNSK